MRDERKKQARSNKNMYMLMVSLFIRCTMRCEIWAQPAELQLVERSVWSIECRGFESHPRQLIFSRKSDCLGCAVLLCLVCLFDLACIFLSFFLLICHLKTCIYGEKNEQISIKITTMVSPMPSISHNER